MSGIIEVIVFLENNPKSKVTDIVKAVGMPIRTVQSHFTYLQELGCLIKTGCKTRYRFSVPATRQYGKTKPPAGKIPMPPVRPPFSVKARKEKIVELVEKGLYLRAQTAISQLIAHSGDQDTVNWALDKNAECSAKTKFH